MMKWVGDEMGIHESSEIHWCLADEDDRTPVQESGLVSYSVYPLGP